MPRRRGPRRKQTARRGGANMARGRIPDAQPSTAEANAPQFATQQVAHPGVYVRSGMALVADAARPSQEPPRTRPIQTARRGGAAMGPGFVFASGHDRVYGDDDDDDDDMDDGFDYSDDYSVDDDDDDDDDDEDDSESDRFEEYDDIGPKNYGQVDWDDDGRVKVLGITWDEYDNKIKDDAYATGITDPSLCTMHSMTGKYFIESNDTRLKKSTPNELFFLTLNLESCVLWATFKFGSIKGIMLFAENPLLTAHRNVPFRWRGWERGGRMIYGNDNKGMMQFAGMGRIEGWFDYCDFISFKGRQVDIRKKLPFPGHVMMLRKWREHSEENYNRAKEARCEGCLARLARDEAERLSQEGV